METDESRIRCLDCLHEVLQRDSVIRNGDCICLPCNERRVNRQFASWAGDALVRLAILALVFATVIRLLG